jgi:hypothetical protein
MLSSMIGSVGSFLGMNEADRIEKNPWYPWNNPGRRSVIQADGT